MVDRWGNTGGNAVHAMPLNGTDSHTHTHTHTESNEDELLPRNPKDQKKYEWCKLAGRVCVCVSLCVAGGDKLWLEICLSTLLDHKSSVSVTGSTLTRWQGVGGRERETHTHTHTGLTP